MKNPMQTYLDLNESRKRLSPVMVSGVVARHLLATNESGRFLDFSIVNRSEATRCRLQVTDRLGDNLAHGKPYAVIGHFVDAAGERVLLVRVFVALGHVQAMGRAAPCSTGAKQRMNYRHSAIRRAEVRTKTSRMPGLSRSRKVGK